MLESEHILEFGGNGTMKYIRFCLFIFMLTMLMHPLFANEKNKLSLTSSEEDWLLAHPVILVGMDPEYAPYEWLNSDGQYVGMAVDYLRLLETKLGIRFEIVKGKSWSQVVEMAKKGEIDILTSIVQTPERLKYFTFSDPYRETQTMIVDNGEGEFIGNLKHLEGKRVSVEKGYFTQELLSRYYPKIELVFANNIAEALQFVLNGKADAYVGDMSAINYAIKNNGLEKLRFSGQTEFLSQHRFAFTKEKTELSSIMTKAMDSISTEESNIILSRWLGMQITHGINAHIIANYAIGIGCLFLLFGYWYYRLHCEIKSRKAAEMREHCRNNVLEMIAKMSPLSHILDSLVLGVEEENPTMICSILLLDKEKKIFSKVIAPSLPNFYNDAIQDMHIGQGIGSCGTSAYTKERVIVEDIKTHPYWKDYKELATCAGVSSCWSQPIFSSEQIVLGTFAIYHSMPSIPSRSDILLIEQSANLASIAIERSMASKKLRESESLYRRLTEDVTDVIWKTDAELNVVYISPADERLRGFKADEVIGHHIFEMFTPEGINVILEKMQQRQESEKKGINTDFVTFDVQHKCKDGRLIWGEIASQPERNEKDQIIGYHGITREITERKEMQEKVQQLAFYDPLTQLPNRLLLNERLSYEMFSIKRNKKYGALMFLDLDNFKSLNDTHGHTVGDLLLCQVAARIQRCVRTIDTVARFGGDEFVVMLHTLNEDKHISTVQANIVAEKIRNSLSLPYTLNVHHKGTEDGVVEHSCTASIGVLVFASDEGNEDDLLKRADMAMYKAKEAGKNTIRFYHL